MLTKIKEYWVWILGALAIIVTIFFQRNKIKELAVENATNQNTTQNAVLQTKIDDSNSALADAKKKLEEEKKADVSDAELLEKLKKI